jgi:hypothetical protein
VMSQQKFPKGGFGDVRIVPEIEQVVGIVCLRPHEEFDDPGHDPCVRAGQAFCKEEKRSVLHIGPKNSEQHMG